MMIRGVGRIALISTVLVASGCAAMNAQMLASAKDEKPTFGNRFKITVVAASIADSKANGEPWHTKEPDNTIPLLTSLASLSMGPIGGELASVVFTDDGAGKSIPPSPVVKIQIGNRVFETATRKAKFHPTWNYSFVVDIRDYGPDSEVVMVIVDDDGDAPIEQFRLTLGDLLGRRDANLEAGVVGSFQIKVDPLPDRPDLRELRFRIPGNESLEKLAQLPGPRFDGDWQAVEVLNGDVVRVKATGSLVAGAFVCTNESSPVGLLGGECMEYNRPEFHDMAHGALVGYLAGDPVFIGSERLIEVSKAGRLILGVNDKDVGNNTGAYDVVVEVNPPDAVRTRSTVPSYVAPAWQKPPQATAPQSNPQLP